MKIVTEGQSHLGWWDAAVVVIYFIIVISVGIWSSRKNTKGSISSYFLASRTMHWIPVGASLFSSGVGTGHFIGLTGAAASSGIVIGGFEIGAVFILMMLGWIFVPVYLSSGVFTMPEYLQLRFGGQRIRLSLAFLTLILYVFTKISSDLYSGALFMQMALGQSSTEWLYISILILLGVSAIFTIAGGLTAVMWTDFVQTILMLIGAFVLMIKAFSEVGGFNGLVTKFPYAIAKNTTLDNSCAIPPKDYMNLFRTIEPGKSDYPWTGMVFGLTINSLWYWCSDQVIVQRTLASRNLSHAKAGCIFASYLKILPLLLMVFPGMISRILFPDRIACSDPKECTAICGSPGGCTNIAYVELVLRLLPTGLRGMMVAVMMAALMSSLTSIFNSASTIFAIDVWPRFRKNASERELLLVGRIAVVVLVVISVIWVPVIQNSGNSTLLNYVLSIISFLSPSICAVFLLAVFWPRTNEQGAFWGLVLGLTFGIIRFAVQFSFPVPPCGSVVPDTRPEFVKIYVDRIHYLHFSCLSFLFTTIIIIGVSLVTKPIPEFCLYRLTYWSRHRTEVRKNVDDYFLDLDSSSNKKEKKLNKDPTVMAIQTTPKQPSYLLRCCGITSDPSTIEIAESEQELKKKEEEKARKAAEFLKEDSKFKWIVEVNAVICVCITVFICGYFA